MNKIIHQRLLRLFVVAVLLLLSAGMAGVAIARVAGQQAKTLDRDLEPVVVPASQIVALVNAPLNQLLVYSYTGSAWVQIPFQVDEKTGTGSYTAMDDGVFNGLDEVVFMASDTGAQADPTMPISVTLPISPAWYEIQVTDPTSGKQGWAYVVRSNSISDSVTTDYVNFVSGQVISGSRYSLGLATGHPGLEQLSMNGGPDIADRTKLRGVIDLPLGGTTTTEEDMSTVSNNLIKDGRVRVIVEQTANDNLPFGSASLNSTYLGYASLVTTTSDINFSILLPGATLVSIRSTVDFNSAASGATFYNSAVPAGVLVNGSSDAVPTTLSTWSQLSHTSGRAIQITDPAPAGGTQESYYRDDVMPEAGDTGEPGSYGETGFLFTGDVNESSKIENWLFVLDPGGNVGNTYQTYFNQRLQVATVASPTADAQTKRLFLPIILK